MSKGRQQFRIEKDSMGEVKVPSDVYYGAQTQRAVDNFPISQLRFTRPFIRALGLIKWAAAQANQELGFLEKRIAQTIRQAAWEVVEGKWDGQFVVDIFQTGSGTSTNMNTNEVIANRAIELLKGTIGSKSPVHPNDHVNLGQSSNDVFPTAIHIACMEEIQNSLLPALQQMHQVLVRKSKQFDRIVKIGRTHLMDATPIRLGQEFGGYARQIEMAIHRIEGTKVSLSELPLGGTAVGTGINTHPQFAQKVIAKINRETGYSFREAKNHFEAQGAQDSLVETSGALKVVAVSLMKIANDIRWLGSGPRCGIGEILLPEVQPGSSIMPGKVNPVIAESLCQVAVQVIGNDLAITIGGQGGNFELNTMLPVMAHNLLESIELLSHSVENFTRQCLTGIQANAERCSSLIEQSLALCTALAPVIGYDAAAKIAQEAYRTGKTVREIAKIKKVLSEEKLKAILDPWKMTQPGTTLAGGGG
ncbi:MAG: class II fumarate hydratase [Nitrospira sp.]|nr:class II fumarate hydratase [Nitrospira sp.]